MNIYKVRCGEEILTISAEGRTIRDDGCLMFYNFTDPIDKGMHTIACFKSWEYFFELKDENEN